jgi:hypothetical protein
MDEKKKAEILIGWRGAIKQIDRERKEHEAKRRK